MFGRDDCNSFVGIFAVIEVASINPLPNARGNGGVFLGFAGVDVLAKADLIALRLKGFDWLIRAGVEAIFNLPCDSLTKLNDGGRGAIVGLEHDAPGRKLGRKLVGAFDRGALKTHDGLIVIANGHDIGRINAVAEQLDDAHLGTIGVLELVNLDIGIGVLEHLAQRVVVLDGVNEVADHVVVIVEMVLVELALVATRDVASGLESLALLHNLKRAPLRVAASKEGIAHLGVSRGFALLIDELGAANGVAQLKNVRHVRAGGTVNRAGERCGCHGADTLDLFLKAFGQHGACPFAGERKQLGMFGEPGSGVDILLRDGAQRVVVQATAFDFGDKADHLTDVLRRHIG